MHQPEPQSCEWPTVSRPKLLKLVACQSQVAGIIVCTRQPGGIEAKDMNFKWEPGKVD
jgi:hypothetical protein